MGEFRQCERLEVWPYAKRGSHAEGVFDMMTQYLLIGTVIGVVAVVFLTPWERILKALRGWAT